MPETNPFIWHELVTPDQQTSGEFFCGLLGWQKRAVEAGGFGTYTLFQKGGVDIAGMMNPTANGPDERPHWHAYIAVEDVDACARRAPDLGGRVVIPPHDVPDVGRVCTVVDPMGATADLLQLADGFSPGG